MEPWGRYGSGFAELAAAVLLLTPRFCWAGAVLALGVMAGAMASHLTVLGIVVQDDGGLLFGLAIGVFIASGITAWLHRRQLLASVHSITGCGCGATGPTQNTTKL